MPKIFFIPEVSSTLTYCKENLESLENGTIIYTDSQTQGRGQFGRKWFSDVKNNVYMSIVLKPENSNKLDKLTLMSGEAVKKTIEAYGLKPEIKLPNDVLIEGKKICGILCESVFSGEKLKGVVVGIGVNINMKTTEIEKIGVRATSMNIELNRDIDRIEFIERLRNNFFNMYEQLSGG